MKIGILTFVRVESFGAVMQCYALSHYISTLGYEVEVIDYPLIPANKKKLYVYKFYSLFSVLKTIGVRGIYQKVKRKSLKTNNGTCSEKSNMTIDFYDRNINHSRMIVSDSDLTEYCKKYDVVIVGSDQVWNYVMSSRVDIYLLSFLNNSQKKIAYAASFGVSSIPFFYKHVYRRYLSLFDFLSLREQMGCNIVKHLINKKSVQVLDPTLLLNAEQMDAVSEECPGIPQQYVLVYDLLGSSFLMQYAHFISSSKNIPIINVNGYNVGQIITLFKNASYVVTSSFHGTAFSIIFRKQFVSICRKGRLTNSRIEDLLKLLCLENSLLYEKMEKNVEFEIKTVAYNKKNDEAFQDALILSKNFINNALQ